VGSWHVWHQESLRSCFHPPQEERYCSAILTYHHENNRCKNDSFPRHPIWKLFGRVSLAAACIRFSGGTWPCCNFSVVSNCTSMLDKSTLHTISPHVMLNSVVILFLSTTSHPFFLLNISWSFLCSQCPLFTFFFSSFFIYFLYCRCLSEIASTPSVGSRRWQLWRLCGGEGSTLSSQKRYHAVINQNTLWFRLHCSTALCSALLC
jgi:hypothetical protein